MQNPSEEIQCSQRDRQRARPFCLDGRTISGEFSGNSSVDMYLERNKICIQNFYMEINSKTDTLGNNFTMNLGEICCKDGIWMEMVQNRVM